MKNILGNKYHNLVWLKENSFLVPRFTYLTKAELNADGALEKKIINFQFPLAARSSFAGEDGGSYSFAGIFESVLHNQNIHQLKNAILKVSDSLQSDRLTQYCQYHQIEAPSWGSIIIQEMVDVEIAGVTFTSSPFQKGSLLISALRGYGDSLVSGSGDPVEVAIDITNPKLVENQFLTVELQQKLLTECQKIAALKKCPQDIEWALDRRGQLFFLQTRDITTVQEDSLIADNSNIQESFSGVSTPLTFSYAKGAYYQAYNTLMKMMGFSDSDLNRHAWRHQHMLCRVSGYTYYNINSWYEGLLLLPSFGKNKKDMETMMGLEKPVDFILDQKKTKIDKLKEVPRIIRLVLLLSIKFTMLTRLVKSFDRNMRIFFSKHRRLNLKRKTLFQVHQYLREIKEVGFSLWGVPLLNDFYVMMKSGKVRRVLESINEESLYPHLILTNDLESFQPVVHLRKLVDIIHSDKGLSAAFKSENNEQLLGRLQTEFAYFWSEVLSFIDLYGDRVPGELKLETKTFRTDKALFVNTLRSFYLQSDSMSTKEGSFDFDLLKKIELKLGGLRYILFKRSLRDLQKGIRYRELMRFHRTRSFGVIREIYLMIATHFLRLNIIDSLDDIFFLTEAEIEDYIYFQSVQNNLKPLIEMRKLEYEQLKKNDIYKNQIQLNHSTNSKNYFDEIGNDVNKGNELAGIGCYPGTVEGEVVIVKDLSSCPDLTDKILLAERTDPGWTPLFYLAKGIIVERGSILSHAAIVAREVGRPIVIGVPRATQVLKNNDRVRIDGSSGKITVIKEKIS